MSDNRKDNNRNNKNSVNGPKSSGKRKQNPNLRLIKNGDLPVEKEIPKKEAPKGASSDGLKKAGVHAAKTEAVKKAGSSNGTEKKGKAGSSKKAKETPKYNNGKKSGTTGKSGTIKKTSGSTKSGGSKKKENSGKTSTGKKLKESGTSTGVKKTGGRAKTAHIWDYERTPVWEKQSAGEWTAQHRSLVIIGFSIFVLATLLVAGYYYIVSTYTVTTVYVDGNVHYTNEEVMDMVMTGRYGKNSIYLALKYKDKGVEGVPFVEKMDVNILSPDTIRINVYEKALAGYVEYLGQYMYFDKDGIITESSPVKTSGIPQVTGLSFEYIVLNEPLPVENEEIFRKILNITQLLTKYDLTADKIFFDSTYDVTLYFEGVRATLGDSDDLDEKIMKLQYILPELEGKKGILRMENYTEDTKNIPFNQD